MHKKKKRLKIHMLNNAHFVKTSLSGRVEFLMIPIMWSCEKVLYKWRWLIYNDIITTLFSSHTSNWNTNSYDLWSRETDCWTILLKTLFFDIIFNLINIYFLVINLIISILFCLFMPESSNIKSIIKSWGSSSDQRKWK